MAQYKHTDVFKIQNKYKEENTVKIGEATWVLLSRTACHGLAVHSFLHSYAL
jgi:hypothetical protein